MLPDLSIKPNWFFKFDFFESNFDSKKKELNQYLEECKGKVELMFLKSFPPCIADIRKSESEYIELSQKKKAVSNNLYYGEEFVKINKLFKNSPFISDRCTKCLQFKKYSCRGLPNENFLSKRDEIIGRIGEDTYLGLREDYENNLLTVGSVCNNNCIFCYAKTVPDHIYKRVPPLLLNEIMHFLHYFSGKVNVAGVGFYVSSRSDFFSHPNYGEILPLLKYFCDKHSRLVTSGNQLDEELVKKIKGINFVLCVSIHTVDMKLRQKLMGYKDDFDIKKAIDLLEKHNIRYIPYLLPLRSTLASGQLRKTVEYLMGRSPQKIYINKGGVSKWTPPESREKILIDTEEVLSNLEGIDFDKNNIEIEGRVFKRGVDYYVKKISAICSHEDETYLVLVPQGSYPHFKKLSSDNIKVKPVSSILGFEPVVGAVLTVEDYQKVAQAEKDYDTIILPRSSLNLNLNDLRLRNINNLWGLWKEKRIYLL